VFGFCHIYLHFRAKQKTPSLKYSNRVSVSILATLIRVGCKQLQICPLEIIKPDQTRSGGDLHQQKNRHEAVSCPFVISDLMVPLSIGQALAPFG
jgi:hypothetical protein